MFSGSNLIRFCGLANILAGLGTAFYWFIHPGLDAANDPRWMLANIMFVFTLVFTLLGLVGLYAIQSVKAGVVGFIGFLLSFLSTSLFVGAGVFDAFVNPVLTVRAKELLDAKGPLLGGPMGVLFAATGMAFALGFVLLAIATARAGVLPRLAAVLLIPSAPVLGLSPLMPVPLRAVACVVFGVANIWLGTALWSRAKSRS